MKLFQHNIHPSPLILGLLCSRVTRILVILVFVQSWQLYLVTLCLRPLSLLCLHIFRSPNPGIPNQMSESYISSFLSLIPFSLSDQLSFFLISSPFGPFGIFLFPHPLRLLESFYFLTLWDFWNLLISSPFETFGILLFPCPLRLFVFMKLAPQPPVTYVSFLFWFSSISL